MKTIISRVLLIVITCIFFTGCSKQEQSNVDDKTSVKIGVQTLVTPELELRYEDKYSEFLGTEVELVQFDAPAELNKALLSGSIDFGFMGSANAAAGISNGVDGQVIWLLDVIGTAESLVAKKESGITNLSDLEGKTVAVPFVSTSHFSLLKALDAEGIDASRVEILDMKPNDIYAAWNRGDIDAAYVWDPVLAKIKGEDSVTIVTSKDVAEMGSMTADVVMVRREFAENHPDIVHGFINAQIYATNLYYTDQDKAIKEIAETADITEDETRGVVEGFDYLNGKDQIRQDYLGSNGQTGNLAKVLKNTSDFLVEQGSISEAPSLEVFEKAVCGQFVEDVLK